MTDYHKKIEVLVETKILPDSRFIAAERYIKPFQDEQSFYTGIVEIPLKPIYTGLYAAIFAAQAVWATLRAVGNLLILKPADAQDALADVAFSSLLTIALAVMVPIHAIALSFELLTRTISSWFMGTEAMDDLTPLNFIGKVTEEITSFDDLLPSSTYLNHSRFFSPYPSAMECIQQFTSPMVIVVRSGYNLLSEAFAAMTSAIDGLSNVLICRPQHAIEHFHDCSVHIAITLGLAIMTPINALVEELAFISRLGTTWVSACADNKSEEVTEQASPTILG